jgi:glycosyltransferase involved in cell wall biosynthesis
MRMLQLIDSLEIGGAEKMAVNFANALNERIAFSGIVVTRKQGKLLDAIDNKENYLFLDKKRTFDFKAVLMLKAYCRKHQIDYIQAHGTSFFFAFLLKLFTPRIKILFHDHSGARSHQKIKSNRILWLASFLFKGIIVVNQSLAKWALQNLNCKNVICLPNFTSIDTSRKETFLKGEDDKRIVSLANLRHPKNHQMLIEVAGKIKPVYPDWTFHLIGKDDNDTYSKVLKKAIDLNHLNETVYIYGQKNDTAHIISQSAICVLTSSSEGLPVALLEYGLSKKPIVVTDVGEIPLLITNGENGFVVNAADTDDFYKSLVKLIENPALRIKFGEELFKTLSENNSEEAVMHNYLNWLKELE